MPTSLFAPTKGGLHKFRKTFATMHHESGFSARTLQSWLGHSSLETTIAYLKISARVPSKPVKWLTKRLRDSPRLQSKNASPIPVRSIPYSRTVCANASAQRNAGRAGEMVRRMVPCRPSH